MGSKHELAQDVASLVGEFDSTRPFLDLFCGMCSVGGAVAPSKRTVWGNDVQWSARMAAQCVLASPVDPLPMSELAEVLEPYFRANKARLTRRFSNDLRIERRILAAPDLDSVQLAERQWKHAGNNAGRAREVRRLASSPTEFPYRLFTLSFAWGYFGLEQAIEIDSLRYAIDEARRTRSLSNAHAEWALLALMQAASCATNSPGHFAQYLHAKTVPTMKRVISQRRRSMWEQFKNEVSVIRPYGDSTWRQNNRVLRRNAVKIWNELKRRGFSDGVIYADPPYSKDHYSRFYHVLETLVLYDYPASDGVGRYRPNRFATPFSLRTQVVKAFEELSRGVAGTGSSMLLSYPTNGLLDCRELQRLLRKSFTHVDLGLCRPVSHSTLGGRHGSASNNVRELVFIATN